MKRKIRNGILMLLGILLAAAAPFAAGIRMAYVKSGSMEPEIHVGSICLMDTNVRKQEIQKGDVIVFSVGKEQALVTHRVADITEKGFRTKGDGNDRKDPWLVSPDDLKGKVLGAIPYLGYVAAFLQSGQGIFLLSGAGILYAGYLFCRKRMRQE